VEQKKSEGWDFVFLAANQDAFSAAANIGFSGGGGGGGSVSGPRTASFDVRDVPAGMSTFSEMIVTASCTPRSLRFSNIPSAKEPDQPDQAEAGEAGEAHEVAEADKADKAAEADESVEAAEFAKFIQVAEAAEAAKAAAKAVETAQPSA